MSSKRDREAEAEALDLLLERMEKRSRGAERHVNENPIQEVQRYDMPEDRRRRR